MHYIKLDLADLGQQTLQVTAADGLKALHIIHDVIGIVAGVDAESDASDGGALGRKEPEDCVDEDIEGIETRDVQDPGEERCFLVDLAACS
jgi:hypothetical protein